MAVRAACWIAMLSAVGLTGATNPEAGMTASQVRALPNPFAAVPGWPVVPRRFNGGRWGEVIRVHAAPDGTIWVFNRCFNTVPAGLASCVDRGPSNPPILAFSQSGKLKRAFGAGLFAFPHGFAIDRKGYIYTTDVSNAATIAGLKADYAKGRRFGGAVFKLDPRSGKVLLTIGTPGRPRPGPDGFDAPAGVSVAENGDIFVADGHFPQDFGTARIVKFAPDGRFLMEWGRKGSNAGEFNEPHDLFVGGSRQRVYVADRRNHRVQVFEQDGTLVAVWPQFHQPSSVYVDARDRLYVGVSYPDPAAKGGELRGILVADALSGRPTAFIPDANDPEKLGSGTSASGVAVDARGNLYAADVGGRAVRKYKPSQTRD